MNSFYQVKDMTSGNVIDDFDNRIEALATLNTIAKEHGQEELRTLSLLHVDGDKQTLIAMASELITLVKHESIELATANATSTTP